jgi:hypothetical protein
MPTLAVVLFCLLPFTLSCAQGVVIPSVSDQPPQGTVLLNNALNAYSIEFKDFPLFAGICKHFRNPILKLTNQLGNISHPNQFSINLLSNLAQKTGAMPICRIGGSTQSVPSSLPGIQLRTYRCAEMMLYILNPRKKPSSL